MNTLDGIVLRVESEDEIQKQQNELSSFKKQLFGLSAGFVGILMLLAATLAMIAHRK